MITATVTTTGDAAARAFLVKITGTLENPRGLNAALAERLTDELRDHFAKKNAEPNKWSAPKTNFWNEVASSTKTKEVTDAGATVQVAEQRFNIHLFGGTIFPKVARSLTIPVIKEARGESVASYRIKTGKRLFSIRGRDMLFERADDGVASESRVNATRTRGRNRTLGIRLGARQGIRAVFALKKSVTIDKDPDALPNDEALLTALRQEADDYVAALNEGGPA
jgi:hypothetical protein